MPIARVLLQYGTCKDTYTPNAEKLPNLLTNAGWVHQAFPWAFAPHEDSQVSNLITVASVALSVVVFVFLSYICCDRVGFDAQREVSA